MFHDFFILCALALGNQGASSSTTVAATPVAPVVEPALEAVRPVTAPVTPAIAANAVEIDVPFATPVGIAGSALPSVEPSLVTSVPGVLRPLVAAKLGADDIVGKVQGFYKDTSRLSAKFRQIYHNATFGRDTQSDGFVWIKKPGRMRWDYLGKDSTKVRKSFISDGVQLWMVEYDNKQAFQKNLEDDVLPVAITFLYGKGDLRRDFNAALDTSGKYGAKGDYVLALTPKKPSAQYKQLHLVVDPGNFRVKQSIVTEASGNVNHFLFYAPNTTRPIDDGLFVFNPRAVKGFRIERLGSKK